MMYDLCRSPVSLSTQSSLGHWNAMTRAVLAHGARTPEHLRDLLAEEPGFSMGHAARGLFSLMLGRAELVAAARDAAAAAHSTADGISGREHGWIAALDHWLAGSPTAAIDALETVLARHREDTLTAKVCHGIRFILGDATGMRASIERVLPAHGTDHPFHGFALGCHAFTLEETGEYQRADATGRAGLIHAPDDAWGLHAVAHVHDMTARPDLGIALIEENAAAWDHCNNFRYHVWWHKALLHLDRGEFDIALGLYDARIRADRTDDYRDIANATSLLMRLELEAVEVGERWDELADLARNRVEDGCLVFADLHYMLALCGAGHPDAIARLTARFARDAARGGEMNARVADPGIAAMSGLRAFAEARYDAAFLNLRAARSAMQGIGGSHAQRDVFERMTIDAGLRSGRVDETAVLLADRRARRSGCDDRFHVTRQAALDRIRRIPAQ